ncbi:MAG: hypothetical protein CVU05_00885 [Bacteroidetes bacterium HGW-Bacteroidetes-21]|nr:MAG: hypothetical protein CVU05_00885 [Bacteroidetes bacterium HGW-Bacteroidetes-21]
MKKTLFLILFFSISILGYSQDITREKNDLVDVGTAELKNGKVIISCKKCIDPENYFVIITPNIDPVELFVSEKRNESFVVESRSSQSGKFDYIVFVKSSVTISTNKKMQ